MRYNITNIEVAIYEKGGESITKERTKNTEFISIRFFTKKGYIEWLPSLEVIAKYLQLKAGLEDKRYPNGEGRVMLARFIERSIKGEDIKELIKEFEVPETKIPYRTNTPKDRQSWVCRCGQQHSFNSEQCQICYQFKNQTQQ